ncbi:MAG: hypothetical protein WDA75_24540 [Candidatus Latescibacterota bacterium]|jgi:hypothetical protein
MAREVMRRRAADNPYLHPDFHGALSCGLEYLHVHFGEAAVRRYLRDFTLSFYAPLREELGRRGLAALKEHYERTYRAEGGDLSCELSADELVVRAESSPAVTHMHQQGYPVARLFGETVATVASALCEGTEYEAELLAYDPDTGGSALRFRRRGAA